MSRTSELTPAAGSDPSIMEAVLDVVEAGQHMLLDRIELVRLDAQRGVAHLRNQLLLWAAVAVALSTAWVLFNCTATVFLANRFSWVVAGAITAGSNAVIGLALIAGSSMRRAGIDSRDSEETK